jgi:hypothetical protein
MVGWDERVEVWCYLHPALLADGSPNSLRGSRSSALPRVVGGDRFEGRERTGNGLRLTAELSDFVDVGYTCKLLWPRNFEGNNGLIAS